LVEGYFKDFLELLDNKSSTLRQSQALIDTPRIRVVAIPTLLSMFKTPLETLFIDHRVFLQPLANINVADCIRLFRVSHHPHKISMWTTIPRMMATRLFN
jgi:hypothetical protein